MTSRSLSTMLLQRLLILFCSLSLLTGCGFQLRGYGETSQLPPELQTLQLSSSDAGNQVLREVRAQLRGSNVTLVEEAEEGIYELRISPERSQERIISLNSGARAGEYAITMIVTFQVRDGSNVILGPEEVNLEQTYVADADNAIAKSEEADLIRDELRRDVARQILNRL